MQIPITIFPMQNPIRIPIMIVPMQIPIGIPVRILPIRIPIQIPIRIPIRTPGGALRPGPALRFYVFLYVLLRRFICLCF